MSDMEQGGTQFRNADEALEMLSVEIRQQYIDRGLLKRNRGYLVGVFGLMCAFIVVAPSRKPNKVQN
jgi:hypothetical protein